MGKTKVFLGIFLLLGLGMLAGGVYSFQSSQRFVAAAEMTTGSVVDLERRESRDSDGNRSITYYPVVRYRLPNGGDHQFRSSTGSNPPSYRQGEEVEVLYLPDDPYQARINGFFSLWGLPVILSGMGLVFAGLPGALLFFSLRRRRIVEQVKASGKPVLATITGAERNTSLKVNGRSPFRISAQWESPTTGKLHVFHSDNLWFDPGEHLPEDKSVTVFIDANDPSRYWMDTRFLPELAD